MKKISFVIMSIAGGGAENVCVTLANGLIERGWEVDLVVITLKNAVYKNKLDKNVGLVDLDSNHARYAFVKLFKYLKKSNAKNVIVFDYQNTVLLVILRAIFGFKYRLIARNINTLGMVKKKSKGFWNKNIVNKLIYKFYGNVDYVINQSKSMESDLLSIFPELKGRTSVVYNPLRKSIVDFSTSCEFTKISSENYLLCIGRLVSQKGFHYAIQSFATLIEEYPDLRLKIVGEGHLKNELEKIAKQLNVHHRIDFVEFQDNIIPYYVNAKATLLTSQYEGFPNVLIESIALGTPVVSFDCKSGPSEIIIDGKNGYLTPVGDVLGFSDQIRKLMTVKIDHKKIIETSHFYHYDTIIDQYEEILLSNSH